MSQDFIAKTRPRWIGSGAGEGTVIIRGGLMQKAGLPPQPGIEARLFGQTIAEKMQPDFVVTMQEATLAAILEATKLGLV
jgi:hypothetical protein